MKSILVSSLIMMVPVAQAYTPADVLLHRDGCRREIRRLAQPSPLSGFYSPIESFDRAEDLVDSPATMVRQPRLMEEQGLLKGKVKQVPWSDSYWPLYKGGIGERYQDASFMELSWEDGKNYIQKNSALELAEAGAWDALSPAEKYDLMFGAKDFPLTKASWDEGRTYFERSGNVETWMGHCHGWAAASMMMKEPKKKVTLKLSTGNGTLYPSDVKGLASVIWSKGNFPTKFIGGRCNSSHPSPRAVDCLDTNPGTWHLAVVNQLGISKRPFIMDAKFDYEVWNHPVYAYEYSYINPKTKEPAKSLKEALVKRGSFRDPLSRHRSQDAVSIVGVMMRVSYVVENSASAEENQDTLTNEVNYEYDLELNAAGEIIGGEWISSNHPDFLWLPDAGSFPASLGDTGDRDFDFTRVSPELKRVVVQNSSRGLPFGPLVRFLVKASAK